jgi:hypothetical protein
MRWSFDMDRKVFISPVAVGCPFRADSDGAFPGLKAWAVLLIRFAVCSNRLAYKDSASHKPVPITQDLPSLKRFSGCLIAVIDDRYSTSRQEDKRQARERRIEFE